MRQKFGPATLDFATPSEVSDIMMQHAGPPCTVIRAASVIVLDAIGNGRDEVYEVPAGGKFYLRRVSLNLSTAIDPGTGNVPLNTAGASVAYYRSGTFMEYAVPESPLGIASIPGVQFWSIEEGPYLANQEVFTCEARGLTAGATLVVAIQGRLER